MNFLKILISVLLVFVSVAAILGLRSRMGYQEQAILYAVTAQKSKGNPKIAKWKIIEYIDFQCSSCKTGSQVIADFLAHSPSEFYVETRHYPLKKHHAFAERAALYAEAAARQEMFWNFHDMLLERQTKWSALSDAEGAFHQIAIDIGLNLDRLQEDLNDSALMKIIESDIQKGKASGVKSTPSYLINEELVVGYTQLRKYFEEKLS